jgi:sugar phosphate isomerase/epimerase
MNVPLSNYMKVGLVHFMAFPSTIKGEGPVEETIKKVALDDYFQVIEVTTVKDPEVRKRVKSILESSHLTVTYGAQPRLLTNGLNINDLREEERQKALNNLKEGIDEAYELGCKGFAFLSGKYEESSKEESYQALVCSTNEICAYVKSKGNMRVTMEVFDYDVDKKSLIGPAPLAARFAAEVRAKHPHFGLMVDLSHIPLLHETNEESILPVKEFITHAHIGNCVMKDPSMNAYGDIHPRFGFPNGENDVDEVVAFLRVLMQIGYLNEKDPPILSFEVKPFGDEDPELVIANAKRTLNLAWAKV